MISVFSLISKLLLYHVAYYPKKIVKIFSKKFGHPERRDRTTPNFRQKLKLGILTKLCLHGVAYDLERLFKTFQTYSVNLRGVAWLYPFTKNLENYCIIIPILVSNKL